MSWFRSVVNRAVEARAGRGTELSRTVKKYAGSVAYQTGNAVAGGTKIFQDRMGPRNMNSFKHTVKRLEEVSVSCRGEERVQLLRRWLVALKEIDKFSTGFTEIDQKNPEEQLVSDESGDSPKPTVVYYFDPDDGEQRTFRDVFLHSEALEGITLSVILEAPNEEESLLLEELYGLSLTGGQNIHQAVTDCVKKMAKAFSEYQYQDEVLVKREELLQYAQDAIAGLKINADLARIDAEARSLKKTIDKDKGIQQPGEEASNETSTMKDPKAALAQINLSSQLEVLLLKKRSLRYGDTPEKHAEKLHKMKVLSESLANSTSKAEKRISEHRVHKEEALHFRVTKANEMNQAEKDLAGEIKELEKQKDTLEAELKRVNTSLASARVRYHNANEEREHFDEACNQLLVHLKTKEDEHFRSIDSFRIEGHVVDSCIDFLECTWGLQTSFTEQREKLVNDELQRCQDYFVNLIINLLSSYKEKIGGLIPLIRKLEENLISMQRSEASLSMDESSSKEINQKNKLEDEYLDIEAKFLTTLSIVDSIRRQFHDKNGGIVRNYNSKVEELFNALEKIKEEFELIKRPVMEIETPTRRSETPIWFGKAPLEGSSPSSKQTNETPNKTKQNQKKDSSLQKPAMVLESDLEFTESDPAEDITSWET